VRYCSVGCPALLNRSDAASGLLSDVSAKVLNSTEDAHVEIMSTFETMSIFGRKSALTSIFGGEGSLERT